MILITGCNGLIGTALAGACNKRRLKIRCHFRTEGTDELFQDTEDRVYLDFQNATADDFANIVRGCTAVIHAAATVHQPNATSAHYQKVNVDGTRMLAEQALKHNCSSFTFVSSSAVYGSGPYVDLREDAPLKPDTAYGESKLASEEWLRVNGGFSKLVIVRPSIVFGPGDRGNMIALIRQIAGGKYFHIAGNQAVKSVIYATDAGRAIVQLATRDVSGEQTCNLANPQPISVVELADQIADLVGLNKKIRTLPKQLLSGAAAVATLVLGQKSPVTPEKIEKLTASTSLSTDALQKAIDFQPAFSVNDALASEILWAGGAGLI